MNKKFKIWLNCFLMLLIAGCIFSKFADATTWELKQILNRIFDETNNRINVTITGESQGFDFDNSTGIDYQPVIGLGVPSDSGMLIGGTECNPIVVRTTTPTRTLVRKETSQDLSVAALCYTTNFAHDTLVKWITLRADTNITETVTVYFESGTSANYTTILDSAALVAQNSFYYSVETDFLLEAGDEIHIGCTNNNGVGTVYVTIMGETIN